MKKHINEKTIENIFNQYFGRCFSVGELALFSPTSIEEAKLGYDSKYNGLVEACEIFFQFKAPSLHTLVETDEEFLNIDINDTQLQTLKKLAKRRCEVFILSHTFRTYQDFNKEVLKQQSPKKFLRNFICIDVKDIRRPANRIRYNVKRRKVVNIFKQNDLDRTKLVYPVYADTLVEKYIKCECGVQINYSKSIIPGELNDNKSKSIKSTNSHYKNLADANVVGYRKKISKS